MQHRLLGYRFEIFRCKKVSRHENSRIHHLDCRRGAVRNPYDFGADAERNSFGTYSHAERNHGRLQTLFGHLRVGLAVRVFLQHRNGHFLGNGRQPHSVYLPCLLLACQHRHRYSVCGDLQNGRCRRCVGNFPVSRRKLRFGGHVRAVATQKIKTEGKIKVFHGEYYATPPSLQFRAYSNKVSSPLAT